MAAIGVSRVGHHAGLITGRAAWSWNVTPPGTGMVRRLRGLTAPRLAVGIVVGVFEALLVGRDGPLPPASTGVFASRQCAATPASGARGRVGGSCSGAGGGAHSWGVGSGDLLVMADGGRWRGVWVVRVDGVVQRRGVMAAAVLDLRARGRFRGVDLADLDAVPRVLFVVVVLFRALLAVFLLFVVVVVVVGLFAGVVVLVDAWADLDARGRVFFFAIVFGAGAVVDGDTFPELDSNVSGAWTVKLAAGGH